MSKNTKLFIEITVATNRNQGRSCQVNYCRFLSKLITPPLIVLHYFSDSYKTYWMLKGGTLVLIV